MTAILVLWREYRNAISVFLTLMAALFLLVTAGGHFNQDRNLVQEGLLQVTAEAQSLILRPVAVVDRLQLRFQELMRLDRENRMYKAELDQLRPLGTRMEELDRENQRLKSLLKMQPEPGYRALAVRVVGDSSSAFARSFIVNAGRQDGVIVNAPVTVPSGLVGRVVRASGSAALVLSMLDLNSRIPVLVQRSRVRAISAGQNSPLLNLEYLPKDADIELGDAVITSGTGGIFPKGLLVGRVVSLEAGEDGLFKRAVAQPMVDFDRIEEAHLLLPQALSSGQTAK
ncbi:MAG: rod shape-determining protein MreC [Magnetococcales bacterium]|nr:rod shape-determining protein MreC [Magnetococcales bacterium]